VLAQVNDNVEALLEQCAENVVVYHNPSSTLAPMFGRYFGIEGFIMWLKVCEDEFTVNSRPHLFNFSTSGSYVFCEMELNVTVKKTSKTLTLSRIMKFLFNAQGKFVVWDIMEDSAPLVQAYKPKVFKAPDGTEFSTRRKVFKYWFNFTDRQGETLVSSVSPWADRCSEQNVDAVNVTDADSQPWRDQWPAFRCRWLQRLYDHPCGLYESSMFVARVVSVVRSWVTV